ncbi:tRNA (adenosine(37)-N6)-threonylcarbamoyltransferase complex dimerization subunit type 1 TsaB [uncultured Veillonella sp.]|uniref:tRNA (adenosine(37)-N6)-threonylcarbamoyltransferase complex dimerization subunit type 1 TsaB n=1 Tax=uncultured Veillonella sp. TaxID=159268 RepID=UPI0025DC3093|nr:tRNA (adenosine(37)-N6)-threonylcarbamoyltransferase complex dimerization subunit type 1 TsaB [uncultured Veillonella sp.]MDY3974348.1 tRNA (adenosine(37)-N6)-threonylcarbamoyltransferase complex dimerization subunit type 1 TsaB [Veillonella caviae]
MYLGIETSSAVSSVALMNETGIFNELTIQAGLTHSEQLVPHIELLLKESKVERSELKGIAVSIGPGSFTGLRIGLGTAKALAYALHIPLIGVMTLDGMAYNFYNTEGLIAIMIDAQKKQVYEGLYTWEKGELVCLQGPTIKKREDALQALNERKEFVTVLGDGLNKISATLEASYPHINLAPPHLRVPKASSLLLKALPQFLNGEDESENLAPYYMRRSEAEVLWDARHPEAKNTSAEKEATVIITEVADQIEK